MLGGPVMPVLIFASVTCVTLIVERFWALRRSQVMPPRLVNEVSKLLADKKTSEALSISRMSETSIGKLLSTTIEASQKPKEDQKEILEAVGRQEASFLEKRLDFLGTLATAGPLLGLFGTVVGMIRVFFVVRTSGVGDPLKLSGGIAEALICTAAGMVVAIPALVFYRYFLYRIDQYVLEMERVIDSMRKLLLGDR